MEEELHVIEWFRKVKVPGAYVRLEDYFRSIESTERHVNLAVPGLREVQSIRGEGPGFLNDLQELVGKDDSQGYKALLADYMLSFAYVAHVRCEGEVNPIPHTENPTYETRNPKPKP